MKPLTIVQAYDRQTISEIPTDDSVALEHKLNLAYSTFNRSKIKLQPHERASILKKTAETLAQEQQRFAQLIAQEGGKPLQDALIEVSRSIDGLNNAAEELRNFAGREIPMGLTRFCEDRLAFTTKEPIGVVAAISAFNHPLNLIVHQVAPAIAVGCPVIVKPAATTPLSCIELVKLLRQAGLAECWCQTLITADNALAERLATDQRIAFLTFIGSAKIGWYLRSKLPAGTHCSLEHGGAAPVIVDQNANLRNCIPALIKGGYYHAGQVCVSVQRIFVHQAILSDFLDAMIPGIQALKVGDPCHKETELGPLILPRETERVLSWIEEAKSLGAKIIGGGRHSATTLVPALILNPSPAAKVSQAEIFGPVTCVYPYQELKQGINMANDLPFSFQASIFTENIDLALQAAQDLDASAVMINDHTAFRVDWMPFAGYKHSGYGIGGIPWTMQEMAREKMIVFKKTRFG